MGWFEILLAIACALIVIGVALGAVLGKKRGKHGCCGCCAACGGCDPHRRAARAHKENAPRG